MRTVLKVATAIVLFLGVFFTGALTAGSRHWFQPLIEMAISNDSGQDVVDVQLILTTGGQKTTSSLGRFEKGQTRSFRFYVRGEGGYLISATLADGSKLGGPAGGYIESGSVVQESITASSIRSAVQLQ